MTRPPMLTILALLAAVGGAFMLIAGVASALPTVFGNAADESADTVAGIIAWTSIGVGAAWAVEAWGLWTRRPWAWLLGMGLATATFLVALAGTVNGTGPVPMVLFGISIVAFYCLVSPAVGAALGRRSGDR